MESLQIPVLNNLSNNRWIDIGDNVLCFDSPSLSFDYFRGSDSYSRSCKFGSTAIQRVGWRKLNDSAGWSCRYSSLCCYTSRLSLISHSRQGRYLHMNDISRAEFRRS